MRSQPDRRPWGLVALAFVALCVPAHGQQPQRLVARPEIPEGRTTEHPLAPVLRWATAGLKDIEAIKDYECVLVKRDRIDGEMGEPQYMQVKVRHRPFSVYVKFLGPAEVKGREAIYIEGANDGNLMAHGTGIERVAGTLSLAPDSPLAMRGQRYPLTKIGVLNLTRELITVGRHDAQYGECDVKYFKNAKVNDRVCTCMQFEHPVPRREFRFHVARIYVDDELELPIRYEAFTWPEEQGGEPVLEEEYTYLNLKTNVGLTDHDFDTANPGYDFP
jgi:hypothetical protein